MKVLSLDKVTKIYDSRSVFGVKELSFNVNAGEIVCLTGPSGSGKTTTLKLIQNEIKAEQGQLEVTTGLSYIPQLAALDDNKTVMENILDGVDPHLDSEKQINLARNAAQSLELTNEFNKRPTEISGGQRQRVIMARALVSEPELIIMDEPFAHLDTQLRCNLIEELWEVFRDKKIAILWVTHDTADALAHSDRVLVLNQGKLQQDAPPRSIYQTPANMFVAKFFGNANCLAGKVTNTHPIEIEFLGKKMLYKKDGFHTCEHRDALVILRPESIRIEPAGKFNGKVKRTLFMGDHQLVDLECQGKPLQMRATPYISYQPGQKVKFDIIEEEVYCIGEI